MQYSEGGAAIFGPLVVSGRLEISMELCYAQKIATHTEIKNVLVIAKQFPQRIKKKKRSKKKKKLTKIKRKNISDIFFSLVMCLSTNGERA